MNRYHPPHQAGGPGRGRWDRSDEALAYYVVSARYGARGLPESVKAEIARIRDAARTDAALAERLRQISERLDGLAEEDEISSFERITGHHLEEDASHPPVSGEGVRDSRESRRTHRGRSVRRKVQDLAGRAASPRQPVRATRGSKWGTTVTGTGAALLLVAALAVGVRMIGVSETSGLARVEAETPVVERALVLRGEANAAEDAARIRYRYARTLLQEGERTLFGVFIGHDRKRVDEAVVLLQRAVGQAPAKSPLRTASQFLLAKAYLAQGRHNDARAILDSASEGAGPYAEKSRELALRVRARRENS